MAKTKRRKESSWKKDKVILMADIKIFRLSSGEDVITEKGDITDTHTSFIKPFVIVPMQQSPGSGQEVRIAFTPFMPYGDQEIIEVKNTHIVSEVLPHTDMKKNYNQYTGRVVEVENKIIT